MNAILAEGGSTVTELAALFASRVKARDPRAPDFWETAHLHPAWDRAWPNSLGWQGYLDAAAVRLITQGESS